MDEYLMKVWLDDIWLEYIKKISKDIGFENWLLTYDAFATHKTDDVESKLHIEMPANGCVHQLTIQSHFAKMLSA